MTGPGVVVLGMHRSGTSAVTRVLNLLGAAVGPEDDLLREFDNPAGHWESRALVACNDRILAAFGRSWDFPPHMAPGWEHTPEARALVPELSAAFVGVFGPGPWVWKDPRTCLTLPLWRTVIGTEARVVFVWRDPGAVVRSVWRRDGIPRVYGAGLWHRYVHEAVHGAVGLPALCVRFEDLVGDPTRAVAELADDLRALGVDLPGDRDAAAASLVGELVHSGRPASFVDRLTAGVADTLATLPRRSERFVAPPWREPGWVRPLLYGYRATWALRARRGHPLRGATTGREVAA